MNAFLASSKTLIVALILTFVGLWNASKYHTLREALSDPTVQLALLGAAGSALAKDFDKDGHPAPPAPPISSGASGSLGLARQEGLANNPGWPPAGTFIAADAPKPVSAVPAAISRAATLALYKQNLPVIGVKK